MGARTGPARNPASTSRRAMLKLDHLTVIAPTLTEGVAHVRSCIDLDVPFGQRHGCMGTHNHLLQLGDSVALDDEQIAYCREASVDACAHCSQDCEYHEDPKRLT